MIETHEFVQFGNECITKSFVSATVRDLDKHFVALFEKEARNPIKYHLLVDLSENCLLYD